MIPRPDRASEHADQIVAGPYLSESPDCNEAYLLTPTP